MKRALARARMADAVHRGDRPVYEAKDLAHQNLSGRSSQPIAPLRAAPALNEPTALEVIEYRFEKFERDLLLFSDLGDLHRHWFNIFS